MAYPQLLLRDATPADAAAAVALLVEAIDHIALALAGVDRHEQAWPLFERLFREGGQRYGHEYVQVLSRGERVVGAVLAYPGRDEARLAAALRLPGQAGQAPSPGLETESADDEYYLDALAVAADERGQGHAATLIEAVAARAASLGFDRVGLLADADKPRLHAWYASLGFVEDGARHIAGHAYRHMVRERLG